MARIPTFNSKASTMTYRRLLSGDDFLRVRERSRQVAGINLISVDYKGFELRFQCSSVTHPDKKYTIIVQLEGLDGDKVVAAGPGLDAVLRDAKMKVYCNCPAFTYWGFAYKSFRYGYGVFPERRFPRIRNPRLRGYTCKHVRAVLMTYPFWSKTIAKKLRGLWTEDQRKQIDKALSDALRRLG